MDHHHIIVNPIGFPRGPTGVNSNLASPKVCARALRLPSGCRVFKTLSRFVNENPLWAKFGNFSNFTAKPNPALSSCDTPPSKCFAGRLTNVKDPQTTNKGLSAEILRVFPKSQTPIYWLLPISPSRWLSRWTMGDPLKCQFPHTKGANETPEGTEMGRGRGTSTRLVKGYAAVGR